MSFEIMLNDLFEFLENENMWETLHELALNDGKITNDELNIIQNFIDSIEKYSELLEKSLSDGVIDDKEKLALCKERTKIMNKIVKKALEDEIITDDEEALINSIRNIMSLIEESESSLK